MFYIRKIGSIPNNIVGSHENHSIYIHVIRLHHLEMRAAFTHRVVDVHVGPGAEPALAARHVFGREGELVDAGHAHGEDSGAGRHVPCTQVISFSSVCNLCTQPQVQSHKITKIREPYSDDVNITNTYIISPLVVSTKQPS